jgi:uncharacterized protein YukE
MPDGFEYDPEKVRGFAEIFNTAASQMQSVQEYMNQPAAKPEDFGKSWKQQATEFQEYMTALATDVSGLVEHLTQIGAKLNEGSDAAQSFDDATANTLASIAQTPADVSAAGDEK